MIGLDIVVVALLDLRFYDWGYLCISNPGHTQKELTANLTLWAQILVPKAPGNPRKNGPPALGLVYLPVPSCTLYLALLHAGPWGLHVGLTTHGRPGSGHQQQQQLQAPSARVRKATGLQQTSNCVDSPEQRAEALSWGWPEQRGLASPLQRARQSSLGLCRRGSVRTLGAPAGPASLATSCAPLTMALQWEF